jgi:hypothetical protein
MTINFPALTRTERSLPVTLRAALDNAADLARAEKSAATQRAYKSDLVFSAHGAPGRAFALCPQIRPPSPRSLPQRRPAASNPRPSGAVSLVSVTATSWPGIPSPTDDERVKAVVRGRAADARHGASKQGRGDCRQGACHGRCEPHGPCRQARPWWLSCCTRLLGDRCCGRRAREGGHRPRVNAARGLAGSAALRALLPWV